MELSTYLSFPLVVVALTKQIIARVIFVLLANIASTEHLSFFQVMVASLVLFSHSGY